MAGAGRLPDNAVFQAGGHQEECQELDCSEEYCGMDYLSMLHTAWRASSGTQGRCITGWQAWLPDRFDRAIRATV